MPFPHSTFEPLSAQRGLSKSPKSHYLARWTYRQTLALSCWSRFHPPQSLDTTFNLPIFILSPVVLALSFYFELFRWIWTWVWEGKALSWANSKSWLLIEWLLLLPLRRHMSILSCVILFKSSTMMQIWWPHCALFPPLYRNLTANMIQTLSVEVLSSLTQLVTWWVWVCFQLTTLVSYVQLGVHIVEAYVFVKGGRSSYLFSQTTAINILFFKQAFTML